MPRTFLTACWQDLVIITWAAPEQLLLPRLPRGLELDRWEGRACVSLVAFDFRGCCVKGLRVPGLVNFPEVNLRYYVREVASGRRGVVFIREFVPSRVIAMVASVVYNEPYRAVPMRRVVEERNDRVRVEHDVGVPGSPLRIVAEADAATETPNEGSLEHFLKEHSWGYGVDRRGRALAYEVRHPVWAVRRGASARVEGDLGRAYGEEWSFLNAAAPVNVMLAVGSEITVLGHAGLR
jgi:uncharacterized protein